MTGSSVRVTLNFTAAVALRKNDVPILYTNNAVRTYILMWEPFIFCGLYI